MDGYIILIIWYLIIIILMDFTHKALINKNKNTKKTEEQLQTIRETKYKTVQEQIKYIKTTNKLYISFPLILVLVAIGAALYILIASIIPNSHAWNIFTAIGWSIVYAKIIISIKQTENDKFYFIIMFLYTLFMTISICINKYYPTKMSFWIILISYIGIYLIWDKWVKKWLL